MKVFVIVSGLSGSGKSVALATLEDCGYSCIDNLPLALLEGFLDRLASGEIPCQRTAISLDSRNLREECWPWLVSRLQEAKIPYQVVFLRASREVLIRRFQETRRRHPLLREGRSLEEALVEEERLLEPVAREAQLLIDTSDLSVHELRRRIFELLCKGEEGLILSLLSFGFKRGVPWDADFVFDARALPNPHWEPELRPLTGRDPAIAAYLEQFPETQTLLGDIETFLDCWLPRFQKQNRPYATVAIGCTGGQHRSVYLVERLTSKFRSKPYISKVLSRHRDLPPEGG